MVLRRRRLLLPFLLLAVSLRVFTGAAEAQISFTSLIADAHANHEVSTQVLSEDGKPAFDTAERAKSIPEKQRSSVTYKKYLTPENSGARILLVEFRPIEKQDLMESTSGYYSILSVKVLRANSPPKASLIATPSLVINKYSFTNWESKIGTSKINNSSWGISSL